MARWRRGNAAVCKTAMQGFESPPGLRGRWSVSLREIWRSQTKLLCEGSNPSRASNHMDWFLNIFSKFPVWALLCFAAISVVAGDVLAKYWSTNVKPIFYFAALIAYAFSGFFYIPTLLREGLVITSVIWSILSIIGFLVVGIVLFKETLTSLQVVGVILGVIALVILTLGE